jgi:hypothetical protein
MWDVLIYQNSSVQVTVSPLPYNPNRDAEVEPINSKITAEDLAWERQRGTLKYQQWKAELATALEQGAMSTATSPAGGAIDGVASPNIQITHINPVVQGELLKNPNVTTKGIGAASPAAAAMRNHQPSTGKKLKALL